MKLRQLSPPSPSLVVMVRNNNTFSDLMVDRGASRFLRADAERVLRRAIDFYTDFYTAGISQCTWTVSIEFAP